MLQIQEAGESVKVRRISREELQLYDDNDTLMLTIQESFKDGVLDIRFTGELRNETAHEVEDEIMAAMTICRLIRLDFSGVTYLASMALKCLLSLQQLVDELDSARMVLVNVSDAAMEILTENGFDEILEIEE